MPDRWSEFQEPEDKWSEFQGEQEPASQESGTYLAERLETKYFGGGDVPAIRRYLETKPGEEGRPTGFRRWYDPSHIPQAAVSAINWLTAPTKGVWSMEPRPESERAIPRIPDVPPLFTPRPRYDA